MLQAEQAKQVTEEINQEIEQAVEQAKQVAEKINPDIEQVAEQAKKKKKAE